MTDTSDESDELSELEMARGAYVGPVDRAEALEAIRRHHTGPVIVDYPKRGFAGGERVRVAGLAWEVGCEIDDDETGAFAFSESEVPLGTGMAYPDAFVLDLAPSGWVAERWTGGLDITFAEGVVVRLVFWHSVLHVTESGDVAPGFGPVKVEIETDDEDDDDGVG